MDKKKHPSLDELLNQVRHSEPVIGEEEAIEWLNTQEGKPLSTSRVKTKTIIMTSIIATIGLIGLVWVNGPNDKFVDQSTTNDISSPNVRADDYLSQPNENKSPYVGADNHLPSLSNENPPTVEKEKHLPSTNPPAIPEQYNPISPIDTPGVDTTEIEKHVRIHVNLAKEGEEPKMVDIEEVYGPTNGIMPPCKPEVNALVLGEADLKNIGIVKDQGVILYQQDHTKEGQIKLKFEKTHLKHYSISSGLFTGLTAPKILPIAISNCHGILQYPTRDNELLPSDYENALAMRVNVNEAGEYLIFWFPRNKDFLKLLPLEVQAEIEQNQDLYHQGFWESKPAEIEEPEHENLTKLKWEPEETTIDIGNRGNALGIRVKGDGIYFKRGRTSYEATDNKIELNLGIGANQNLEQQFTETNPDNIYPIYATNDFFYRGMNSHIDAFFGGTAESFSFDKFRLVAIKVSQPDVPWVGDRLFWYAYSPALKSMLSPEEQTAIEAKLAKIDPSIRFDPKRPKYDKWEEYFVEERPVAEAVNALQLNDDVLGRMGIKVDSGKSIKVIHAYKSKSGMAIFAETYSKEHTVMEMVTNAQGQFAPKEMEIVWDSLQTERLLQVSKALMCITDDLGSAPRLLTGGDYKMNELIPVLVRSGQTYTLSDKINQNWRPDIILWFVPTPEILAIIESGGQEAVWGEVKSTEIPDTTSEGVDCRYTEVCRNKVGVFHDQKIFPNPAAGYSNFSWTAEEASDYSIKLYALNGKEVRAYVGLKAGEGKNQYMMDLSNLPPGIYMVILTSAKGDEMHERLVVRE